MLKYGKYVFNLEWIEEEDLKIVEKFADKSKKVVEHLMKTAHGTLELYFRIGKDGVYRLTDVKIVPGPTKK